jgi:hypothetical protein
MAPAMPQIMYDIINMITSLIRLVGIVALGVGISYLAMDLLHKSLDWRIQIGLFLGMTGLVIAMVVFQAPGALGGFGVGLTAAIFI